LCETGFESRYDVKYGSAGFNPYGYKGGCNFALGNYDTAIADPASSRYLCNRSDSRSIVCLFDFSGEGVCGSIDVNDGFYAAFSVRFTLDSAGCDCTQFDLSSVFFGDINSSIKMVRKELYEEIFVIP
jgi:hypothetical protein